VTPSKPLPVVEVRRPSAERGADDAREHLDADPCGLCGCPDADLVRVEISWTGKFGMRRVCRGHVEHPDHPGYAERENPTDYRFCSRCEALGQWVNSDGLCSDCRMDFDKDELAAYLDDARNAQTDGRA
jgi:hypothetical protein